LARVRGRKVGAGRFGHHYTKFSRGTNSEGRSRARDRKPPTTLRKKKKGTSTKGPVYKKRDLSNTKNPCPTKGYYKTKRLVDKHARGRR